MFEQYYFIGRITQFIYRIYVLSELSMISHCIMLSQDFPQDPTNINEYPW